MRQYVFLGMLTLAVAFSLTACSKAANIQRPSLKHAQWTGSLFDGTQSGQLHRNQNG
jgi:hypothetical protein